MDLNQDEKKAVRHTQNNNGDIFNQRNKKIYEPENMVDIAIKIQTAYLCTSSSKDFNLNQ